MATENGDVKDASSTAHIYMLKSKNGENIPVRIICPDVLPTVRQGDELAGQVVLFAESIRKVSKTQLDGRITAGHDDTVTLIGCITDGFVTSFSFEEQTYEFWKLDADSENGGITVVFPCDRMDFTPEIGDYFSATGVISMDVAVPHKYRVERNRTHYEDPYENMIPDADEVKYRNGFVPDYPNNQKVIIDCIKSDDYTRLMRCCLDTVDVLSPDAEGAYKQIDKEEISKIFRMQLPKHRERLEVTHLLSCNPDHLLGHDVIAIYSAGKPHTLLHFSVNESGAISAIELLDANDYKIGLDHELHLHAKLAEAMCDAKPYVLEDYLAPGCMYRSEFSDACTVGAGNIIQRMEAVMEALDGDRVYTFRHALTENELHAQDDLAPIYQGRHCTIYHYEGELAYIAFLMYNEEHKITNILLSRNSSYLKAFDNRIGPPCPAERIRKVTDILSEAYGGFDTLQAMRQNEIPDPDADGVYVWKKADEFALSWLSENGYRVSAANLFDDCLGYVCERKGVDYAVYFYAFGKERTAMLDGDYCAKLRDTEMAKGRTIIVIYLHVDKTVQDTGDIEYTVEGYCGRGCNVEPWLVTEAMGKKMLLFYPRKEMVDMVPRLIAAFNARDLDALKVMCTKDVYLDTFERGGRSLNDGFYSHLSHIREEHGTARLAYLRFNDVVYCDVPYLDNYAYIGFTANAENKIDSITVYPLNNSYRELLISDEIITHSPANEVPKIVSVDFLPPSEVCRYSLRVVFENGEIKRYDLEGAFGDNEVTNYQRKVMTDKIVANGRLTDHIPMPDWMGYRHYAERGQGIEFINGTSISALEIYYNGYPIEKFNYTGMDVFVRQSDYDESGFAVGYISHLDPQNPDYLLDKNSMTATTIPAKYQHTPVGIYPFYGGCSEGLVMVSEMGEVDLQYHHNRGPCAGLWGWLDTNLNVVIEPKYVYAMNFWNGRAMVCKGEWSTKTTEDGKVQYWCENEQWGVIDRNENEIVPCRFDEIYEIDDTDRLYFVHEGGWENGQYAIYDVKENAIILVLDFDFDMGYMFNECTVTDDNILVFDEHVPGEEKDLIYAYDLTHKAWIAHGDELTGRTLNGETRLAVYREGKEIIIF